VSIEALNWAKRQTVGCPGRKAVLVSLADRADEGWSCFPSIQLVATETELSERSVQRHVHRLASDGMIHVEARPGRRSRYTLAPGVTPDMLTPVTPDMLTPVTPDTVTGATVSPLTKPPVTPDKNDISPTPPIKLNPQREPKESTPLSVPPRRSTREFALTPPPTADPDKRGRQLTADWRPPLELRRAMKAELGITDEEIDAHVREFVDYWTGVPGSRGKKLSWDGAFRNRLREQDRLGRLRRRTPSRGGGTPASRVRDRLRAAATDPTGERGEVIDVEPVRGRGDDPEGR
jgi:hypothetical protein